MTDTPVPHDHRHEPPGDHPIDLLFGELDLDAQWSDWDDEPDRAHPGVA